MTEPYYQDATVTVYAGDCLDVLRNLPDNSVDSVVTDPPYGLEFMGKEWDAPWAKQFTGINGGPPLPDRQLHVNPRCVACGGYQRGTKKPCQCDTPKFNDTQAAAVGRKNRGFQDWCELWAAECLRVLKPGGHMLAFGGTRTFHRLTCAVEDAGFEIRDNLAWLYGSGFPKSRDIGKAIDAMGGIPDLSDEIAVAIKAAREARGWTKGQADRHFCGGSTNWTWYEGRKGVARPPSSADFARIVTEWPELAYLAESIAAVEREVIGRSAHKSGIGNASKGHYTVGGTVAEHVDITAPATEAAQQWDGWGTALKPAFEPIVVARKPLSERTVAANVLRWGTGALNIDGSRIETSDNLNGGTYSSNYNAKVPDGDERTGAALGMYQPGAKPKGPFVQPSGRWPANVILDEGQAAQLDQQSGALKSPGTYQRNSVGFDNDTAYGHFDDQRTMQSGFGDSGGASRFFKVAQTDPLDQLPARFYYTAKAGSDERVTYTKLGAGFGNQNYGGYKTRTCDTCEVRFPATGDQPCGHDGWSWQEQLDRKPDTVAHPTVKPLDLMRWLVRLVTPPGGTVLEPFAGSGTTVEACILEGFRCIAIEREADYLPLITQRIHRRRDPVAYMTAAGEDLGLFADDGPAA